MTWLRRTCAFALLATACFNPSDDDGAADTGSTGSADDDDDGTDTITTTMTSSVSATNPTMGDDDDDATDPSITATDPDDDTSDDADDTTTDPDDTGTTDPGTTTDTGEPTVCNPVGDDCGNDEFCDAPDCVTQGVCVARPKSTSPTMAPACGCNDTSYWNIEHAHWLGATAFETDINGCGGGDATPCGVDGDCSADGSACVTDHGLGSGSCTNDEEGECWAIPDNADCEGAPLQPEVGFGSCVSGPNTCDENYLVLCEAMIAGDFFAICL